MEEIYRKLEKAKLLIIEKYFDEAIDILNICKKETNENWEIFFELGKIYYIKKQFDEAVDSFIKSLKLKDNCYTKLLLAKSLKELNFFFRALRLFLNVRQSNSDLKTEIDNEIISMFVKKQDYLSALRYINNYKVNCKLYLEAEEILNNLKIQIGILNFEGNYIKARKLALKALNTLEFLDLKTKNVLLNEIEISNNEVHLKSFPRILKIDVTKNCNLKCRMCAVRSHKFINGQITKTDLKILNFLFKYAEFVEWHGGEPLTYKYLKYFMDIANKNRVKQSVISNGLLLEDEYVRRIVDYKMDLTISIDSVNKKIYENIRVGSSFKLLLKNIENFCNYRNIKKINTKFKLNAVLSRWNYNDANNFIDIIEFANKYKFTDMDIYCDSLEQDLNLKREYIYLFNSKRKDLINLAKNYNINLSIQVPEIDSKFKIDTFNDSINTTLSQKYCLLPWKKVHVKFDKTISTDAFCPEIGFLRSNTKSFFINEIWNGKKISKIRENIIKNKVESIKDLCRMSNYRFLRKG